MFTESGHQAVLRQDVAQRIDEGLLLQRDLDNGKEHNYCTAFPNMVENRWPIFPWYLVLSIHGKERKSLLKHFEAFVQLIDSYKSQCGPLKGILLYISKHLFNRGYTIQSTIDWKIHYWLKCQWICIKWNFDRYYNTYIYWIITVDIETNECPIIYGHCNFILSSLKKDAFPYIR